MDKIYLNFSNENPNYEKKIFDNNLIFNNDINYKKLLNYYNTDLKKNLKENLKFWLNKMYNINKNDNVIENIDDLFIINNVYHGLESIINKFSRENDILIIEEPYDIKIKSIINKKLKIFTIALKKDGFDLKSLLNILKNNRDKKIFFFTIPYHHNPTGLSMSFVKKMVLTNFINKYENFYIIADESFQFNIWDKNINSRYYLPLSKLCSRNVFSIGSLIKITSPNLKLFWIYHKNISKIKIFESNNNLNMLDLIIFNDLILNDFLIKYISEQNDLLIDKCDKLKNKLIEIGISKCFSYNGIYLWIKLECEKIDKIKEICKYYNINFSFGSDYIFQIDDKEFNYFDNYIRFNISLYSEKECLEGLVRLTKIINNIKKIKILLIQDKKYKNKLNLNDDNLIIYNDNNAINIVDVIIVLSENNYENLLFEQNLKIPLIILNQQNLNYNKLNKYSENAPVNIVKNLSESLLMIRNLINNLLNDNKIIINQKNISNNIFLNEINCIDKNLNKNKIINLKNEDEIIKISYSNNDNLINKTFFNNIFWIINKKNGLYIDKMKYENALDKHDLYEFFKKKYLLIVDYNENTILEYLNKINQDNKYDFIYGYILIKVTNNSNFNCEFYKKNLQKNKFDLGSSILVCNYLKNKMNLNDHNFLMNNIKNDYFFEENKNISLSYPVVPNIFLIEEVEDKIREVLDFDFIEIDEIMLYSLYDNCIVIELDSNIFNFNKDIVIMLGNLIKEVLDNYKLKNTIISFLYVHVGINSNEFLFLRTYDPKINDEIFLSSLSLLSSYQFYRNIYENNTKTFLEKKIILNNKNLCILSLINNKIYIDINESYYLDNDIENILESLKENDEYISLD
jgi:DNA-binding transcriptional MocR family regulator